MYFIAYWYLTLNSVVHHPLQLLWIWIVKPCGFLFIRYVIHIIYTLIWRIVERFDFYLLPLFDQRISCGRGQSNYFIFLLAFDTDDTQCYSHNNIMTTEILHWPSTVQVLMLYDRFLMSVHMFSFIRAKLACTKYLICANVRRKIRFEQMACVNSATAWK